MPVAGTTFRVLGVAALLVVALGLGVFLGAPEAAVAQEDTTTTTVVQDDSTETTVDESRSESEESRPDRGDHDCGPDSEEGSSEDSALSNA